MVVGIHIIADFYGVEAELISSVETVREIMEGAVSAGNLTKLGSSYHQFKPYGASGVILLAESHLSFHTWPEYNTVTLDLFTCGDPDGGYKAYEYLLNVLKPTHVEYQKFDRGVKVEKFECSLESAEVPKEPVVSYTLTGPVRK